MECLSGPKRVWKKSEEERWWVCPGEYIVEFDIFSTGELDEIGKHGGASPERALSIAVKEERMTSITNGNTSNTPPDGGVDKLGG